MRVEWGGEPRFVGYSCDEGWEGEKEMEGDGEGGEKGGKRGAGVRETYDGMDGRDRRTGAQENERAIGCV